MDYEEALYRPELPLQLWEFSGLKSNPGIFSAVAAPSNATAPAFLCVEKCGWMPVVDFVFTRCFFQGIVLQIPTAIMLTFGLGTLFFYRQRKELTHTPRAYIAKQKWRFIIQTLSTVLLVVVFFVEAISSAKSLSKSWEIGTVGPALQAMSLVLAWLLAYVELFKATKPSGASLLFYLSFFALQLIQLTSLTPNVYQPGWAPRWLQITGILLSGIAFFVQWFQPHRQREDSRYLNPYDNADLISRLFFDWITPLMRQGYEHYLTSDDLPPLASNDRTDTCNDKLEYFWRAQVETHPESPSLFVALLQSFGPRYALGGLCKAVQDSLAFMQPQLLRLLIAFVAEYTASKGAIPLTRGIYIAFGMFFVSAFQTLILHQYFERSFGTGMNVRTAITNAIFRKSLVLSGEARATRTTGDTVNLMSIDTQRLQEVCTNGNMIWSGPFQIFLCLFSLYKLVGKSMWIGVFILFILVPINSRLAAKQKTLQRAQMKDKDLRTRLTSELLSSIKSIKLHAWEDAFKSRLEDVRENKELKSLKQIGVFNACMSYIWGFTPFLVSCSTFAVYVFVSERPLTTDIVFPALALFNMLSFPMAVFPMLISSLIESNVALKRIQNYFLGEELQSDAVQHVPAAAEVGDDAIVLKDATYVYKEAYARSGPYAIHNVNMKVKKGELSCVVGRVGCGKTSLLLSLLGDTRKVSGNATIAGSVAYVAQNPWIFNGTVRENILFGLKYDEDLYAETLFACALNDDLEILPEGDQSIVGEKGLSLSGGQKARLSLARAVYARADIYLLDDPLSAVDEHVGQHIINNVLHKDGVLGSRTVLLATNSIPVVQQADHVAMIAGSEIVEQGALGDDLPRIKAILSEYGRKSDDTPSSASSTVTVSVKSESPAPTDEEEPQKYLSKNNGNRTRRGSGRRPSAASLAAVVPLDVRKEHVERGKVSWDVYKEYAHVCGVPRVFVFIGILVLSTGLSVAGNVWLKHWADDNAETGENEHVLWYLSIYGILGALSASLTVCQSIFVYVFIGIHAARQLHEKMLAAVIRAPMAFFETNPLGRIVNRFSNDVYRVDQALVRVFFMLFNNCVKVSFTLIIICYSTPLFMVVATPLAYFYVYYQQYYLRTSRELKRLDSISKSPIYNQFQETLDGIATVRAFDATKRFNFTNRCYIDTNNEAYFLSLGANRWLAVRLELVGSIVILAASGLAVLSLPSGRINAGIIGLALSYALQVTQSLNWIVRMTVEVETNIVSVERMMEYAGLKPEAPAIIPDHRPAAGWPEHGQVSMVDYSTRYRPELPLVLKNISLAIEAGEKIGIVGRTGAGKSSLTLALFRLIEATSGHIEIDDVHTDLIGLKDLRSNLSIIPQDSQLFEGSVRENLDPAHRYSDANLWEALELSNLKDHIESMEGQLDAAINEGGSNLSSGQRQLLSLARALLTNSKILVLDEATAAVDVETDQVVQRVIRDKFKDRTILTIAHRLNTILDSDRIIVLGFGEVKEFDSPEKLLNDQKSMFYALAKRGGIV